MASVDGLVTGMSTTDTIAQLMKIEAAPQAALKTKITTATKVVTAYQSINSRMSSVATAAKALNDSDTWGTMKATSSSDAAVVTARPGSSAGSLTFRVDQLAAAEAQTFTTATVPSTTDATGSPVLTGSSFDVVLNDGSTKSLTPKNASLASVVAAINGETDLPYKASAVLIGPGQYTLQLTAREGGAAGAAKVAAAGLPTGLNLGAAAVTTTAADAKLTVDGPVGQFEVTSSTNTFADVVPGVTVTAAKVQAVADPPVTITMTTDAEGIAAKVQALIDNANVALTEIAGQSKIKSGDTAAGTLVGDSAMRKLTQDIIGAITGGAPGLGKSGSTASFNEIGIGVDRSGKITFNKDTFVTAYETDPAATEKYFNHFEDKSGTTKFDPGYDTSVGLARKLETVALIATEGVVDPANPARAKEGILAGLIQRRNDNIRGLNDQVSQWDIRLDLRKTNLQKQFSALEVAMGKMQQQSSWLSSQLANL
jgi:flagellar hook-associated protein 2